MKPEHFAYWMKGYIDNNGNHPSMDDWNKIKNTLIDCFIKESMSSGMGGGTGRNEVYHIITGKPNSGYYGGGG